MYQQANNHLERMCTGLLAATRLRCTHSVLEHAIYDSDYGSVRADIAARSIRQTNVEKSLRK